MKQKSVRGCMGNGYNKIFYLYKAKNHNVSFFTNNSK